MIVRNTLIINTTARLHNDKYHYSPPLSIQRNQNRWLKPSLIIKTWIDDKGLWLKNYQLNLIMIGDTDYKINAWKNYQWTAEICAQTENLSTQSDKKINRWYRNQWQKLSSIIKINMPIRFKNRWDWNFFD